MPLRFAAALLLLATASPARAQDAVDVARRHLVAEHAAFGLTAADVAGLTVSSVVPAPRGGVTHVYLQQRHEGIEVFGALASVAVRDGRVVHAALRFEADVAARVEGTAAALPAPAAAEAAAHALGLVPTEAFTVSTSKAGGVLVSDGGIASSPIPARLVLQPVDGGRIRPAWHLEIDAAASTDWWSVRVDAETGALLQRGNWTVEERPRAPLRPASTAAVRAAERSAAFHAALAPARTGAAAGTYLVYALPTESPIHGPARLLVDPADPTASPFGWHDDDGQTGADHTHTEGNNVAAYEDTRDDNLPGYAPDGGPGLVFDFEADLTADPVANRDAAITNLFYVANTVHDVLFHLGFDEAAGNFQDINYTGLGEGRDAVQAEAQDGGGLNNANFATPTDGRPPRMQMYVWSDGFVADVAAPASVAGVYSVGRAAFGPGIPSSGLSARLVLADDGTTSGPLACGPLVNPEAIAGQIALVDRGDCNFTVKVRNAQDAGAVAVLVANNVPDELVTLGGDDLSITIPSGMISQEDGARLRGTRDPVQLTLRPRALPLDGAFDNGVVIHEYVHGLTTRLTGGPNVSDGLRNAEQMGEGWSDFFALALTTRPDARATDPRGLATFLLREDATGSGLRSRAYSTNLTANDATYDDIKSARRGDDGVVPHDVGEVWATMLWDLYWAYVDRYGFDPDLAGNPDSGNRRALQLVVDALKLQPVRPGFVDARDALLAADRITGGTDACLIWGTFARRGLGHGALQGDPDDVLDGTESTAVPLACLDLTTDDEDAALPPAFALHGNYPEPFNPTTTLRFDLPAPADVEVTVFDLLGRRVLSVPARAVAAGSGRTLRLDAGGLASGVYLYHLTARTADATLVRAGRMTVVK